MDDELERSIAQALAETLRDVAPGKVEGRLRELGWNEVAAEDPTAASRLLYTAIGEQLAPVESLSRVGLDAMTPACDNCVGCERLLLARGGIDCLVAGKWSNGIGRLDALILSPLQSADRFAAILQTGPAEMSLWIGSLPETAFKALHGWDASLGWSAVDGSFAVPADDLVPLDQVTLEAAESAVRRAAAQILIGCSTRILDIAIDHVKNRHQFGRPIGSYQAVQHAMADVHVAIAAASGLAELAWASGGVSDSVFAKASASHAYTVAAANAQQVCGGMGMSWEFPLHRYVRRGAVVDAMTGSRTMLTRSLGASLLERLETEAAQGPGCG